MRFTKTLSALGVVGIAGALALTTTTNANAAPAAQASDRLEGPWVMQHSQNAPSWFFPLTVVDGRVQVQPTKNSAAGAAAVASNVSIPASGTTGPIKSNKECLDRGAFHSTYGYALTFTACEESKPSQQFLNTNGYLTATDLSGYRFDLTGSSDIGQAWLRSSGFQVSEVEYMVESVLTPVAAVTELAAEVTSVDAGAREAVVSGTGEPGAIITIAGPNGSQDATVGSDGTWSVTVPGLADGDNPIKVTQTSGSDVQTKDLVATLLPSPIVAPAMAGGAGVAAIAALGTVFMIRRKRATV